MKANQPLFRVVKRDNQSTLRLLGFYLAAVLISLVIGAILLTILGVPAGTIIKICLPWA